MSEPVPDPTKPPSTPEPTEDPWRLAFVEFKKRDEKMVADYREEIDTLLVFVRRPHRLLIPRLTILPSQAGLFSAVLTAFVVESYQSLQEDYTKTSADLLRQISHQLANASFPAAPNPSPFQAQRPDVRVNVCWFVSLLLSLVVALFGIFLKQWMRAYMKWTDVTPEREAVAIRQLRYRSLETWRLQAILALLPTLLQLSVILFLSGLLIFLLNLDRKVAHVMEVLLIITFSLVATVTFLPVILPSCPFRSPLSEIIAFTLRRAAAYTTYALSPLAIFLVFIQSGFRHPDSAHWIARYRSNITSWVQADEGVVSESEKSYFSMHVRAMVHLCCTTQSQQLLSAALTTIVAERAADGFVGLGSRTQNIYFNQVWWPVLGHVSMITEEDLKSDGSLSDWTISKTAPVALKRLSSSMQDYWVSFLLHSKRLVCEARSTRVAASYMICCVATIESSTSGPQCMQAFMEVLEAQHQNLEGSQIHNVATCLESSSKAALLHSLSGLSFIVRPIVS
jgi:hypothetical protein